MSESINTKTTSSPFRGLWGEVVFENDSFVAVNKPAGLLSIPDREQTQTSLKDILLEKYGSIYTVHRLDKDTSGIIIFAKTEAAHKYFSRLFEGREIEKYYMGLVHGIPSPKKEPLMRPLQNMVCRKVFI